METESNPQIHFRFLTFCFPIFRISLVTSAAAFSRIIYQTSASNGLWLRTSACGQCPKRSAREENGVRVSCNGRNSANFCFFAWFGCYCLSVIRRERGRQLWLLTRSTINGRPKTALLRRALGNSIQCHAQPCQAT